MRPQAPLVLSLLFVSLLVLAVLRDWVGYRRLFRAGTMTKHSLTANMSADVVSALVGIGAAYTVSRLITGWINDRTWQVPAWALTAGSIGVSLLVVVTISKVYSHFVDGMIRAVFLRRDDSELFQEGGAE